MGHPPRDKGDTEMHRIIVTAEVEDAKKWEKGFRTHGDLFRDQTITALHFTVTKQNEAALYIECDDADTYFKLMDSDATAEAMKFDGVKRETVKIYSLDKVFDL